MQSFYNGAPPLEKAEDVFAAYRVHLESRNGDEISFAKREARMKEKFDQSSIRASIQIDAKRFNRNYVQFQEKDISLEEMALLSFVKINAGEAYGVEVTREARAHLWELPDAVYQVEKLVAREEDFHTRLLVGAVQHFADLNVEGAWRPSWVLKVLIHGLARFPQSFFHPVLLGAEVSGLHVFNWFLHRVGTLFKDDPEVRASMEERLLDILVDEVGHIAFNRVLVGAVGRKVSPRIARMVTEGHRVMSKELKFLGFDAKAMRSVEDFDYDMLPQEVKDRAFFA